MPLLREGQVIGVIVLSRVEPGGFTDSQVELLQTFAEQAVIAIRSAETYPRVAGTTAALAQRNSEFGERIEQQAATIDVLKAMSARRMIPSQCSIRSFSTQRELCDAHMASSPCLAVG